MNGMRAARTITLLNSQMKGFHGAKWVERKPMTWFKPW
jgi:hypothetical protein